MTPVELVIDEPLQPLGGWELNAAQASIVASPPIDASDPDAPSSHEPHSYPITGGLESRGLRCSPKIGALRDGASSWCLAAKGPADQAGRSRHEGGGRVSDRIRIARTTSALRHCLSP